MSFQLSFKNAVDYCEEKNEKVKTEWSLEEVKLARKLLKVNPGCHK